MHDSAPNHAMVITAVHLDAAGKPVRYKVENSWGPDVGDKGYFVMSDKWFEEYVFLYLEYCDLSCDGYPELPSLDTFIRLLFPNPWHRRTFSKFTRLAIPLCSHLGT
jgi:hypothetical protein